MMISCVIFFEYNNTVFSQRNTIQYIPFLEYFKIKVIISRCTLRTS